MRFRGRVGRGAAQAYCHLLTAPGEALAADALSHRMIPSWRATSEGLGPRDLVARLLDHVRARMVELQEATGHLYNLEATPAEGA